MAIPVDDRDKIFVTLEPLDVVFLLLFLVSYAMASVLCCHKAVRRPKSHRYERSLIPRQGSRLWRNI